MGEEHSSNGMLNYPEIIIIVGSGRAGTSYLAGALTVTMDLGFMSEPKFVADLYSRLETFGELNSPQNMRRLVNAVHDTRPFHALDERKGIPTSADEILDLVREPSYTSVLYAAFTLIAKKRGRSRLAYKDPLDSVNVSLVADILPTSRFIHIIRDGRDVAQSLLKFRWGPTNLYAASKYWANVTAKARADGQKLSNDRYFEFRFEDLLFDTERVARKLGEFVTRETSSKKIQQLITRIQQTKNMSAANRWKNSLNEREIYICEAVSSKVLDECGYPLQFDGQAHLSDLYTSFYGWMDLVNRGINVFSRKFRS